MGRKWKASGVTATMSTNNQRYTALTLISATGCLPELIEHNIGCQGTPADAALQWILQRCTTTGTPGAAVTPKPTHPAWSGISCLASAGQTHASGSEPSYTSGEIMFEIGLHSRASFLWQAQQGCEIVLPATANNGVGMGAKSPSYASTGHSSFLFQD